jgi:hypothetical protein
MEKNNILQVGSKNLSTENWKVYHPNGRHMFTCGEKKALWYLERNLAKTINGERAIKLTFEPKGNGFEDNEIFGRSIRVVQCVVTGISEGLQRHHIVPYCYRTYFPEIYKSKNHHDVVLMNFEIHSDYEQKANVFKDEVARMYNLKTIGELNAEYTAKLRELGKPNAIILNTIHSLFKTYGRLSQEAILEKLQYLADNTCIPLETLKGYNYIQFYKLYLLLRKQHIDDLYHFKIDYRKQFDHGYHVVQKLDTEDKIEEFVKLWRNHFVDTMQPLFMPTGWSIDFRIKTKI